MWGGLRSIGWVSLFYAYNSVVFRRLGQSDGGNNEAVGENNRLDTSVARKRPVRLFTRNEF